MGFHGVLGSKSFRVSKGGWILKIVPKCLVLNICLKTIVCDVLRVGLGETSLRAKGQNGDAQNGGSAGVQGGRDTQGMCPGRGPVGGTNLVGTGPGSILMNNLL